MENQVAVLHIYVYIYIYTYASVCRRSCRFKQGEIIIRILPQSLVLT